MEVINGRSTEFINFFFLCMLVIIQTSDVRSHIPDDDFARHIDNFNYCDERMRSGECVRYAQAESFSETTMQSNQNDMARGRHKSAQFGAM